MGRFSPANPGVGRSTRLKRSSRPSGLAISSWPAPLRLAATAVAVSGQYCMASVAERYGRSPLRACIRDWFFTDQSTEGTTARRAASALRSWASSARSGSNQITSTSPSGGCAVRPCKASQTAFLMNPAAIQQSGRPKCDTTSSRRHRTGSVRRRASSCLSNVSFMAQASALSNNRTRIDIRITAFGDHPACYVGQVPGLIEGARDDHSWVGS